MASKNLNNLSPEELCAVLRIKDTRTLSTTDGFPKPFFDTGKILFSKEEISKFFNIENIDEPFIVLKEAAELLDSTLPHVQYLCEANHIPHYRLKSAKGSAYLFRKSEIEEYGKVVVEGSVEYINQFKGTHILRDLIMDFVKTHIKDEETAREYDMISKYFLDGLNFESIAKEYDLTRERVRQIFSKSTKRIKNLIADTGKENIIEMKRKIIHHKIENDYLRDELSKFKSGTFSDLGKNIYLEINQIRDIFITSLGLELSNCDLSTRALTCLQQKFYNIYDVMMFTRGDNKQLLKLRNLGEITYKEIQDFLREKETELEKLSGINPKNFFNNEPKSERDYLLFKQIHIHFQKK